MSNFTRNILKTKDARCPWPTAGDPLYLAYHDEEWGVPVHDDRKIYEFLVLEVFQAGLSWRTVLYKRENFRKAFAGFDYRKVARFGRREVARLLKDQGISRHHQRTTLHRGPGRIWHVCRLYVVVGAGQTDRAPLPRAGGLSALHRRSR